MTTGNNQQFGMGIATPPFGGNGGQYLQLSPSNNVPDSGYRVISGLVWWQFIYLPWRKFIAVRAYNSTNHIHPPRLGSPTAQGIYFTDRESLVGVLGPGDFAYRCGLSAQTQTQCQLYGCAIIQFKIKSTHNVVVPKPSHFVSTAGMTVGGAREWLLQGNLDLSEDMRVYFVDINTSGQRWCNILL